MFRPADERDVGLRRTGARMSWWSNVSIFPADFLHPYDKPVRVPLQVWGERVRDELKVLAADPIGRHVEISIGMNLAALIQSFAGRLDEARSICLAELAWVEELSKRVHRDDALLHLAFQPWINLGRLLRLQGRSDEALEHFSPALAAKRGESLQLGPCAVPGNSWNRILNGTPSFAQFLWTVFVLDSLRTHLATRAFSDAHDFARRWFGGDATEHVSAFLQEGSVLALGGMGAFEAAHESARSAERPDGYSDAVFYLHTATALLAMNRIDEARVKARQLAALVGVGGLDSVDGPTAMRFLMLLGRLLEQLEEERLAFAVFKKGYDVACALGDQPFTVGFCDRAQQVCRPDESGYWHELLERHAAHCLYREVRRRHPAMEPTGTDEQDLAVLDDLLDMVETVVDGHAHVPAHHGV
ncbi:MAG: tetratricopeptide repeat protein [Actinobacteria bacterium]|nr:tetratricopeptide repeat protein [Actinomycetota bacterium]